MATNAQDLISESTCFACLGSDPAQSMRIALMARTLKVRVPTASTNVQDLITYASCYLCVGISLADAVELALLDQIAAAPCGSSSSGIAASILAQKQDVTSAATSTVTPIFQPSANALILCTITVGGVGAPGITSLSGNGLTWVQVNVATLGSSATWVFRAMGAAPTYGALTVNWSGALNGGTCINVIQFTGVDTSGTNGSGAVVQSGAAGTPGITLAAISSARNAVLGASGSSGGTQDGVVESGWTNANNVAASNCNQFSSYRLATTDNTYASGKAGAASVALEIKAA